MSVDESEISFPEANIAAVKSIAGVLATTIGPICHDKFVGRETDSQTASGTVSYDDYVITSDGTTILEALPLEHPIAPVVRRMASDERPGETDTEGEQTSDGVTTTLILTASLLDEAEALLEQGFHPSTIQRGYARALTVATDSLQQFRRPLESFSDRLEAERAVARTAMTGNDIGGMRDRWAAFAADAAANVGYPTPERFGIERVSSGSIDDSQLLAGTVLPRNGVAHSRMPTSVEDATVLVLSGYKRNDAGDGRVGGLRDPELQEDATINVDDPSELEAFDDVHADRRRQIVTELVGHDVDVVVTRLGINDQFLELLADHGIMGIRGVNRIKLGRVAQATGAVMVRDASDVVAADLGYAGSVEQQQVDKREGRRKRRKAVVFDGCHDPSSMTVFLRGHWGQLGSETTREIRKATAAVATARGEHGSRSGVVPGGGAADIGVASAVRSDAPGYDSRAQFAMEAFADAVERVPFGLAKNGGLDPRTTVADLRAATDEQATAGLLLPDGEITDVVADGVLDPYAIKHDTYVTAVEVAGTVLRIDDAIDAETSQEPADEGDAIYDDRAETHQDHLDEHGTEGTVWD